MNKTMGITDLERRVVEMLLSGNHSTLETLRAQFAVSEVSQREFTGVGFFTHFAIPPDAPRVAGKRSFQLGDVHADIPGLRLGADFILFITEGAIDFLEGFTHGDDQWPETVDTFRLTYVHTVGAVVRGTSRERDWEALWRVLGP
ncbi:MAG: hypothetical protein H5U08_06885 [Thermogutta sp.]|nr:hypothetical protein [Thermogutta sp.]